MSDLKPDLFVVVAFGQILPQAILDLAPHGCLNVHTSLLPRYRGAGPIQWALLNGDAETGVTIMKMDAGLDTGAIVATRSTLIADSDNAQTLHDRLAQFGAELLVTTIPEYVAGRIQPVPQPADGGAYARKITKEDGRLDWTQPATVLRNRVRALTPWPGGYSFQTVAEKPRLLKIWRVMAGAESGEPGRVLTADGSGLVVACGVGSLHVLELQREGGRRMSAGEFLNARDLKKGDLLK